MKITSYLNRLIRFKTQYIEPFLNLSCIKQHRIELPNSIEDVKNGKYKREDNLNNTYVN